MYDIDRLLSKELFWTKRNGRDELMTVNRFSGSALSLDEIRLPWFHLDYEEELKQLGVSYEIDGDKLLIHDPDVEEYKEIPAYFMTILAGNMPKPIYSSPGKPQKHIGKIPTNNMLEAAHLYYKKVSEDLKQLVLPKEQKLFDEYFEKNSKDGILRWNRSRLVH